MPGYEKLDLYPHDMAKARALIEPANPSDREITVWTDNESPNTSTPDLDSGWSNWFENYPQLDKSFMEQAPWAPYGTLTSSTFVSSAIDLDKVIFNPTFGQDLTSFQFK